MNIPPELIVFFSAMLPITELRGSIPLGFVMGLPAETTFIYALIGNIIPCFFILWVLEPIAKFLSRHIAFFKKFFDKLYKRTHDKHKDALEKYGPIFLIIFVSIPLPGSGAWTGSLIAFLFGIKYFKALTYIFIGLIIAATLITLGITGVINLF
ncbi:COG2426 family protein [Patescibacteria group bacterium]